MASCSLTGRYSSVNLVLGKWCFFQWSCRYAEYLQITELALSHLMVLIVIDCNGSHAIEKLDVIYASCNNLEAQGTHLPRLIPARTTWVVKSSILCRLSITPFQYTCLELELLQSHLTSLVSRLSTLWHVLDRSHQSPGAGIHTIYTQVRCLVDAGSPCWSFMSTKGPLFTTKQEACLSRSGRRSFKTMSAPRCYLQFSFEL